MQTESIDTKFRRKFAKPLSVLGFVETRDLRFVREVVGSIQIIQFHDSFDHRTKEWRFDFIVAVHIKAIEQLLRPDEMRGTVWCPIQLLREDRHMRQWYINDKHCVSQVMKQLHMYGLPFLNRCSDIAEVKRQLESDDPLDWFTLSPQQRICTLAAIHAVAGNEGQAVSILDAALVEWRHERPKKWWALEQLRNRIMGSGAVTGGE